ncbi:T-lymphocyte surface antigen Ly-9-like isoform X1 [Crotalus tigris]|uniref:T-lymphocyte surface antigen Ly-9-like isoform X1 n=2 Tax=Crotalus tigris TaxID=88082 RepID=UPI00192F57E1|nr:T-lymphocyte surface antigen Ly-9-like isoform X1 [Crotalus tigris]
MWQLWIMAFFPLAALQGVDHDSKDSKGSQQEFRDGLSRSNKTMPENETSAPWRSAWVVSTSGPLLTGQSSPDYKARRLAAPTIIVQAQNGTCQVLLSCAGAEEEAGHLNFTWLQVNGSEVLSTAQTLQISQKPQQGVPDYICTVRNQAGESSSVISLKEHCQDPSIPSKYLSASFYAKYIVPLLIVLVILLVLFLMYRRKRGREIHSSMESINESSDSDNEVPPSVEQMAEVSFLPEGIKPFSQDNTSTAGAESTISNQENASDTRKQLPTQA